MKYRLKKELPGLNEGATITPDDGLVLSAWCIEDYPDWFEPVEEPKGKTARQWLHELPDGYRELALKNLDDPNVQKIAGFREVRTFTNILDGLNISFDWQTSPEAWHFWKDVHAHYIDDSPLPPLPKTNHAEHIMNPGDQEVSPYFELFGKVTDLEYRVQRLETLPTPPDKTEATTPEAHTAKEEEKPTPKLVDLDEVLEIINAEIRKNRIQKIPVITEENIRSGVLDKETQMAQLADRRREGLYVASELIKMHYSV